MYKLVGCLRGSVFLLSVILLAGCGGGGGSDGPTADTTHTERVEVSTEFAERFDIRYDGLGYQVEFDRHYEQLEGLSLAEFERNYSTDTGAYLEQVSWDITTASFWAELQDSRYKLNQVEIDRLKKNGFVVSERLDRDSFADHYYDIFGDDLPVFITTDSVLHAWHRSYDAILMETEETWISPTIDALLGSMAEQIPEVMNQQSQPEFRAAIEDADLFIAVARSLLAGEAVPSKLDQDARTDEILQAIALKEIMDISLFGEQRTEDFSQYKPRGHYTESEALKRYFRAMMWLGRTDFNVALAVEGAQPAYTLQQLLAGVVLYDLLRGSQQLENLQAVDAFLQLYVGQVDSMTLAQFETLLKQSNITSLADLRNMDEVHNLQAALLLSDWGVQAIQSRPFSYKQQDTYTDLPRSLTFLGQRFTIDSWVTEMTTHDNIDTRRDNFRFIPSALDTAFAVLGNNQVVPELAARMGNSGLQWRDGIEYQQLLASSREVLDKQTESAWQSSISNHWLYTLRALSEPTTAAPYPEAMRTKAWASKTLDTQLASWTELRHDTILYVKQPVGGGACYYPEGFVEPRIEFWRRLEDLARRSSQGIAALANTAEGAALSERQSEQARFLNNFADTVADLGKIAEKQLAEQELTADDRWYLENIVEIVETYSVLGGVIKLYNGWYPALFYTGHFDSANNDALIADVHSSIPTPDGAYEGHVMNQATGYVNLMAIAIENGDDKVVYLGPVMSHYEFRTPVEVRLNDDEWKQRLRDGDAPPHSEWTLDYLVPEN